jgi:cysteine desulfurase/selenocysteine lyase
MNEITRIQTAYDIEAVRADFPILSERPYGKPLAYLDNAASAQKPRAVIDRLTRFYEHEYANVHRGLHYLANAATEGYEGARETLRRFLNAESTDEIISPAARPGLNLVAALAKRISAKATRLSFDDGYHSNIVLTFSRERKAPC